MRLAGVAAMLFLAAAPLLAADLPRITFSKTFPGSDPAFVLIVLDKDGHGVYKEAPDDDNPLAFDLAPPEVEAVFGLAAKLDRFSKPLEAPVKVAFMGDKVFRWESGAEKHEAKFNYSASPDAQQLWDWFERMAETERLFAALELEACFDSRRLVAAAQFLPLLDRIAASERYMHMARERAAALAGSIRNPPKAAAQ